MGTIQGSINSMLGTASHTVGMMRGIKALQAKQPTAASPQAVAAETAKTNAQNEVEAKRQQKEAFENMHTSLGRMGDLPENLQKRIQEALTNGRDKE